MLQALSPLPEIKLILVDCIPSEANYVGPDVTSSTLNHLTKLTSSDLFTLYTRLDSVKERDALVQLALSIAAFNTKPIESELSETRSFEIHDLAEHELEPGQERGISISVGKNEIKIQGISLRDLQKRMRESIIAHGDIYAHSENVDLINEVKHYVASEELAHDLAYGIAEPSATLSTKTSPLITNSKPILEALNKAVKDKNPSCMAIIDLNNNPESVLTLEQVNRDVAVKIGEQQLMLYNETFVTLLKNCCEDIQNNPDLYGADTVAYAATLPRLKGFTLYHKGRAVDSPAINKSRPYMSLPNGLSPVNLNGGVVTIALPEGSENPILEIVCRHLATQIIKDLLEGNGAVDLAQFSTKEALAAHISIEIDEIFSTLIENAKQYSLINNNDLGVHLKACFENMQDKNESLKVLMLTSINHVMAFVLQIKSSTNGPVYVIKFYDGNKTNSFVRCRKDNLSSLESHTLEHYTNSLTLLGRRYYPAYYPSDKQCSMLMECDLTSLVKKSTQTIKTLSNFPEGPLTPTHMYFMIAENFFHDLYRLFLSGKLQAIGVNSQDELSALLEARHISGTCALVKAFIENHENTIKVFGHFLPLISNQDKLIAIIAAKGSDKTPAVYYAFEGGHTDTLNIVGKWIELVSNQNSRAELIAAKDEEGVPSVYYAYENRHANAIRAHFQWIKLITNEKVRTELIAAKDNDGMPSVAYSFKHKHADVIQAHGEGIALVSNQNARAELIAAKDANGMPAVHWASRHGDIATFTAWSSQLRFITDDHLLVSLITAKNKQGDLAIKVAQQRGHTGIVNAFKGLCHLVKNDVLRNQLIDILKRAA